MRIATWNVNSLKARMPRVVEWLKTAEADVVCIQETKLAQDGLGDLEFGALGYEVVHHGQGQWNGVAIASRVGLDDPHVSFGDETIDGEARLVAATCAGVEVYSAYVPNGRDVADDHYAYKLAWLDRLCHIVTEADKRNEHLVVCGDFNIAPTDIDVYDPEAFADSTHVSEPERAALSALTEVGLRDVFRERYPQPLLYSYWDYRKGMFHMHKGMRIDLCLASPSLADRASFALIDRNARKGSKPSDHAPVIVDFDLD